MRPRGLKLIPGAEHKTSQAIAAHAAAWIETSFTFFSNPSGVIAAHAAAWIETQVGDDTVSSAAIAARL